MTLTQCKVYKMSKKWPAGLSGKMLLRIFSGLLHMEANLEAREHIWLMCQGSSFHLSEMVPSLSPVSSSYNTYDTFRQMTLCKKRYRCCVLNLCTEPSRLFLWVCNQTDMTVILISTKMIKLKQIRIFSKCWNIPLNLAGLHKELTNPKALISKSTANPKAMPDDLCPLDSLSISSI